MLNSGGNLKWFSTLEALSLILMPHWFILYRPNQMEISIFQKESQVSSPVYNRITKPRVLSVSLWMMAKYPDAASEAKRKLNCFLLPSKNCTTTDHLNEDHMIYCLSAYLHFLLTSAMLKVAESELLCVDPTRPRHCSFLLISRGPHLAKTPNKAICPDPRSAAIFAQPQCVLACSAEHHMWQDVVMMAAKHSSAISEHYLCCSPVIWMCVGHRWHQGVEGWRQFVLFPFPHLTLFFFFLHWKTWTAATSSEQPVQTKAQGSQWSKVAAFLSTFTSKSTPLLRHQCRAKQVVFHQQSPKSFDFNANTPQRAWAE